VTGDHAAWLVTLAEGAGAGAAVGVAYFATLWWTVRRAARTTRPRAFIVGSFLVRGIVAAALLVALAGAHPWRLVAALGGFLVVRAVSVRLARASMPSPAASRPSLEEG
jgi:F1F0 ATPase subunit 2